MVMNTPLYLIPPNSVLNSTDSDQEAGFDHFSQAASWDETLYLGSFGASAPLLALNSTTSTPDQTWICLELVHIHATRDHLVLLPSNELEISSDEELGLRTSVSDLLFEIAPEAISIGERFWLFPTNVFDSLQTHSPKLAFGNNIDIWMPKDTNIPGLARKWRQIQNEIQMIWHDHPINQARQNKSLASINSLWIHGIGNLNQLNPHPLFKNIKQVISNKSFAPAFASWQKKLHTPLNQFNSNSITPGTLIDASDESITDLWESIWQSSLDKLHSGNISEIIVLDSSQGQLMKTTLTKKDFGTSITDRLFKRNNLKSITHPEWNAFLDRTIKWDIIQK